MGQKLWVIPSNWMADETSDKDKAEDTKAQENTEQGMC